MPKRAGKVFLKGQGWISAATEADAQYENLGDGWDLFISFCRWWPDFFLDILWDDDAEYEISLIQRMMLRINARYRDVDITGCRGVTKSFCTDIYEYTAALLWPGVTTGIFGPNAKQDAGIARKIFAQIKRNAPILADLLVVENEGRDVFKISTPYGSEVSIEAFRGNTMHWVVAEESAQEDKQGVFNADVFKENVIPQVRASYKHRGQKNPAFIQYRQHSITSAGRRQQYAYQTRKRHRIDMMQGKSAFVIDIPVDAVLLCQIRDVEWVEKQIEEIGVSGVPRELYSIYSGNEKNPLIPDEDLDSARCLALMETHHCCNDRDNKLKPEEVIYVLGFDVSYRDNKKNAKCAIVVMKLTKQDDWLRRDKYLKQIVWIEDWFPGETPTPIMNAQRVKKIFARYCFEGSQTYLAIDAWQVGNDVVTALMSDLKDGLRPFCTYRHLEYSELELEGALPVIYPIRAGGVGTRDPDSEMIDYMQKQFRYGNIQLLTANLNEGVEAYKQAHRIKDDSLNYKIAQPYVKTEELVQQVKNLRELPSGQGIREDRISNHIQRDSWSASKYAGRMAQVLERANLARKQEKDPWKDAFKKGVGLKCMGVGTGVTRMRGVGRVGGRRF